MRKSKGNMAGRPIIGVSLKLPTTKDFLYIRELVTVSLSSQTSILRYVLVFIIPNLREIFIILYIGRLHI